LRVNAVEQSAAAATDIDVVVNNKPVRVPKHTTGAEVKVRAGVPSSYQLFRIDGKSEHEVRDDERITVHRDERFVASPTLDPS
jgi:hypothetical protein